MADTSDPKKTSAKDDFAQAAQEAQIGIIREFWDLLCYNKKWWMTPIIIVLLLVCLLAVAGPAYAPFIYTIF